MRVALVAGPDPGHAFPAFALAQRLVAQDISATVYTGTRWFDAARARGVDIAELPGLSVADDEDDTDAGHKLSVRAARMAVALAPILASRGTDLVVSDVLTTAGSWAAELCGVPSIELSPHPLYLPSRGLPPIGAGLVPGTGVRGHLRDAVLRAAGNASVRVGRRQRAAARSSIGLSECAPMPQPRMIATLPALEVPRPDWPEQAHLVGPLLWEPTTQELDVPPGSGPLIVIAPSTAQIGARDMLDSAMSALSARAARSPVRVVISRLDAGRVHEVAAGSGMTVRAGLGRQDLLVRHADLVICGGGHGMLVKALSAGVPVVTVPGGGDQWELACRVTRLGAGIAVRPVGADTIGTAVGTVLDSPGQYRAAARRVAGSAADVVDPVRVVRTVHRRFTGTHPRDTRSASRGAMGCD